MTNTWRHLYGLEVGVPSPKWEDTEPELVRPEGRAIPRVGRRAHRFLTRAQSVELLQPTIEPYPRGSGFVRDAAELQLRISQARHLLAELSVTSHDWAAHEQDQAKKIVLQRGGPPGWFIIPDGLICETAPSLLQEFSAIAEWLGRRTTPSVGPAPRYRRNTSHGYPDYLTTDLSFMLHAFWARASDDFDDLIEKGQILAAILDETSPPSAAMYNRTGPLGKPVAGLSRTEAGAFIDSRLTGLCCRRRVVFGMPSAGNMMQVPWAHALKYRQAQVPNLWHLGPADVASKLRAWHGRGWAWWSDDISKYDQSVSDTHQRELSQTVIARFAGSEAARFKLKWKDLPLLGPGLDTGSEGFLYKKLGMTPSGDLLTAFDGTFINFARIIRCMRAITGKSAEEVLQGLNSWWACVVQGDDTVIGMERGLMKTDVYVETSAELGYSTKLVEGAVFLMHHIRPSSGEWAPLASRVFQQTAFNEYPGVSPAVELFSYIARTGAAFWRSNPWAERVTALLQDGEPFSKYGVTPFTAATALTNPRFINDLQHELGLTSHRAERFKSLDTDWIASHVSDAAAALLDDRAELPLPPVAPVTAWSAAQRLAGYMAIPSDLRPRHLPSLPGDAQTYLDYVANSATGGNDAD